MTTVKLIVLVTDEYRDRILDVMENLQALGMQIDQLMEITGVITGVISTDKIEALKDVAGVAAIGPTQNFQLNPPESDIQ